VNNMDKNLSREIRYFVRSSEDREAIGLINQLVEVVGDLEDAVDRLNDQTSEMNDQIKDLEDAKDDLEEVIRQFESGE